VQPPDRSILDAVAYGIAHGLLGDPAAAREVAERSVDWLEAHAEATAARPLAWLAATTVDLALAVPPVPGRLVDADRRELAALVGSQPVGARVAFALAGFCGYDRTTVAALVGRSVGEVDALLAPFAGAVLPPAEPPGAPVASPPPPPPPFRTDEPIVADHHLPPNPPVADADAPQPARAGRRRFRVSLGTVGSLLVVAALVAVITIPHGERPSFADAARLPDRTTSSGGSTGRCDGPTNGAADRLDLATARTSARFFLPPGTNRDVPLVVLIGDAREPADEIASSAGLEGAGATQGFAVLTLDGTDHDWNVAGVPGRRDDVALVRSAIAAATHTGCVDGARVVLVGFGRGAHLAAAAACRDATSVAGLVMVRGAYLPPACHLERPVPVLMDTDTTDAVLPFDGGWGSSASSDASYTPTGVGDTFDGWSELDGCDSASSTATDPSGAVVTTRASCADGAVLESLVSTGYGHTWPRDLLPRLVQAIAAWT
jgi:polyhydroxybutyrate depolymerase